MKRLIAALVVVAGGIAGAAFGLPVDAANVNGQAITQDQLNRDLSAIASSPAYQCVLNATIVSQSGGQASLPPVTGVGSGTYNMAFVGYWLSEMIDRTLVEQLAQAHHATFTTTSLNDARNELLSSMQDTLSRVSGTQDACPVSPSAVLSSLPASLQDELVRSQASVDALLASGSGRSVGQGALERYFAVHRSSFDTLCVSGILVASQTTAEQLRSQIESGTSFGAVARANSLDTASAARGGSLGCFRASPNDSGVYQAVSSLAVGQVTQPLQSDQGAYVLLQLTARRPATFSQVRAAVLAAVLALGDRQASALVGRAARRAEVSVNPSYGHWIAAQATRGVLPPPSPPPTSLLSPAANQASVGTAPSSDDG